MARVSTPDPSEVADAYVEGTSGAGSDFAEAALAASDEFLSNASSDQAQSNFEQQMSRQEVLQRRQDNLNDQARQKYEERVDNFGATRYQQGTQAARDDFQEAEAEVLSAIDGLQIPDRGTALSQNNIDRFRQVAEALNEVGGSV
jgi:hypothetical protein